MYFDNDKVINEVYQVRQRRSGDTRYAELLGLASPPTKELKVERARAQARSRRPNIRLA